MRQQLYSKLILSFLSNVKKRALEILADEMHLHSIKGYPLHFTVFEDPNLLGYYKPDLYEIGISKTLLGTDHWVDVLRHELAHFYTHFKHGNTQTPHGHEFQTTCDKFSWGAHIKQATSIKTTKQRQLEKLLALSQSTNPHEAESALLKAQSLATELPEPETDTLALARPITVKRATQKLHAIASITRTFGISVVLNRGQTHTYLELIGYPENVKLATQTALFLSHELEELYKNEQTLKGMRAKNAFFTGLAEGYLAKLNKETALIPAPPITMIYPRLSSARIQTSNHFARKLGQKRGKNLSLKKVLRLVKKR
ncbi:MAG: hypothetical protein SP1CHLAM54_05730 [Chlamydiia bacterium]|nr:hypothetical protein [Chlamydiia bacterium]MCH9615483.1 hypothetical protein [Chlamydiia bacterium]MCH9629138.1 hypothetical protein [Chlamydiia bacterium]